MHVCLAAMNVAANTTSHVEWLRQQVDGHVSEGRAHKTFRYRFCGNGVSMAYASKRFACIGIAYSSSWAVSLGGCSTTMIRPTWMSSCLSVAGRRRVEGVWTLEIPESGR